MQLVSTRIILDKLEKLALGLCENRKRATNTAAVPPATALVLIVFRSFPFPCPLERNRGGPASRIIPNKSYVFISMQVGIGVEFSGD